MLNRAKANDFFISLYLTALYLTALYLTALAVTLPGAAHAAGYCALFRSGAETETFYRAQVQRPELLKFLSDEAPLTLVLAPRPGGQSGDGTAFQWPNPGSQITACSINKFILLRADPEPIVVNLDKISLSEMKDLAELSLNTASADWQSRTTIASAGQPKDDLIFIAQILGVDLLISPRERKIIELIPGTVTLAPESLPICPPN